MFYKIPFTNTNPLDWNKKPNKNFIFTPDTMYLMTRGLYTHNVNKIANDATLGHLKKYNMEWGIPVAPEARDVEGKCFGD